MLYWENGLIKNEENPHGFNFSNNYSGMAWEGVRSYNIGNNEHHVLFLKEHMDRLLKSALALNLKSKYTSDQLCEATHNIISNFEDKNIYFRPCIFIDRLAEGVSKKENEDYSVAIYPTPISKLPKPKNGINMCISSYRRGYPQFQMQIKNSSNYLVGQMAKEDATRQGFDDALFQDNNGYITEAIVSNFFIIKNDIIYTPPNDGSILEGITRNWIINKSGFNVKEKHLTRYDVYTADAAFISGTFVELNHVTQIDHVTYYTHELYEDLVNRYYRFICKLD
ncbi:MAG: hypothetical protein HC836_40210 [Richelia sp. RM2_1_2]|nr:hypothetical protein [Richelia sp. RM2_1_2]